MAAKIIDEFSHLTIQQAYYQRHKAEIVKKVAAKRWANLDEHKKARRLIDKKRRESGKVAEWRKKWSERDADYRLLEWARRRSVTQNVPCTITREDIHIPEYCPITGLKLQAHTGTSKENSPSIDKVIPALGYTPGNVRIISKKANRWKQEMLREDVQKVLDYIDGKI